MGGTLSFSAKIQTNCEDKHLSGGNNLTSGGASDNTGLNN